MWRGLPIFQTQIQGVANRNRIGVLSAQKGTFIIQITPDNILKQHNIFLSQPPLSSNQEGRG